MFFNKTTMKKKYINPALQVDYVAEELPIAQSNKVNGESVNLNPNSIEAGNGSDAVKANAYNVWDDEWK
jgi:hypothetical protein